MPIRTRKRFYFEPLKLEVIVNGYNIEIREDGVSIFHENASCARFLYGDWDWGKLIVYTKVAAKKMRLDVYADEFPQPFLDIWRDPNYRDLVFGFEELPIDA